MTRIAFISDIHANLEALTAVLADIDRTGVDMTICLGDIIGYGADPKACIDIVREREIQSLLGNHDEYATLIMDPRVDRLRPEVKAAVEWNQSKLPMEYLTWLAALPSHMDADIFEIIHGSFYAPNNYAYCRDEESFAQSFEYQERPLAFCGHSHRPLIGYQTPEGRVFVDYIHSKPIPEDAKILINVGSVGQPRDGDPRATVLYYDIETRTPTLKRIEYDVKTTMEKIMKTPLSEKFAKRLEIGK